MKTKCLGDQDPLNGIHLFQFQVDFSATLTKGEKYSKYSQSDLRVSLESKLGLYWMSYFCDPTHFFWYKDVQYKVDILSLLVISSTGSHMELEGVASLVT